MEGLSLHSSLAPMVLCLHRLVCQCVFLSLGFYLSEGKAGADRLVKIWDAYTGEIIVTFQGHTEGISDIAWSSDNVYIASASDDKTIIIWSLESVSFRSSVTFRIYHAYEIARPSQDTAWPYKFCFMFELQSYVKSPCVGWL